MLARRHLRFASAAMAGALALLSGGARGEILDRVAAVVGNDAIAVSEIDTDLRLEALLNRTELGARSQRNNEVLQRLIDRRLVSQDLAIAPFLKAQPEEVEEQMEQLRREQFLDGRDFAAALLHYGVTEADCRKFLEERIGFERYVSFRFETGLEAETAAVEAFYRDEYAARQRAMGQPVEPLEAVAETISQILVARQANVLLERRIQELRVSRRIKILASALEEPQR